MTNIVAKTKARIHALLLLIPVVPVLLTLALTASGFANYEGVFDLRQDEVITPMPPSSLPSVPLPINEHVQREIDHLTIGNGRYTVEKWLSRSQKYLPMMKKIFAEEGVPQELIYLSFIESGLNPTVASGAKAVGLWQFIQSTGSAYGLKVTSYTDGRRNPEVATRAAARLLKDLYNTMGDWHLALSTYNCSMGAIKRAMVKYNSTTYWGILQGIPKETRDYVPRYIAATIIASNPEKYGFTNIWYEQELPSETVTINGSHNLDEVGKAIGVSALEIKVLNPELLQTKTPPTQQTGDAGYALKIPAGLSQKFYAAYGKQAKPANVAHNSADRYEDMAQAGF